MTPATLASELQTLLPADGRAFGVPARREYRTRVSRRRETGRLVVARAVPAGSVRASSQGAFLTAVRESPALAHLRADGLATVLEVAKHLAWCASWDSMTSRPTWGVLQARTGRSRATIARALLQLRRAGLVGIVATGRSGAYTPAARDAGVAEAAVYVLCVPSPLAPVDEDETPTGASPVSGTHPPHARARQLPSEPLRGRPDRAAARPGAPVEHDEQPPSRPTDPTSAPAGVPHALASRPADELDAPRRPDGARLEVAAGLRERLPVLRRISDRHVASIVREFVLAGWTTSELAAAIDRRPDGTAWPHDGAAGVGNVGAWLTYRLAPWRDETGTVRSSPSRVATAAARQRLAVQRAEREAAARVQVASPDSPALSTIRATIAAARASTPWRSR